MSHLLKRFPLAPRLALGFGLVLLVMSLAAGIGIWRLHGLQAIADDLGGDSSERALLAQELHAIVVLSSFRAETLLQIDDAGFAARINADRKQTSQRSDAVRKRLEQLADTDRTKELFDRIDDTGKVFRERRNALVKRKEAGEAISEGDITQQLRPAAADYSAAVNDLASYQRDRVKQAREAAQASSRLGISLLVSGMIAGGLLGAALAWQISRSITLPLRRASWLAGRVAAGDLSSAISPDGGRDEVQTLVTDLGVMQQKLANLVLQVQLTSGSIATASSEIATGNQDLSSRTEQTASNLQATASSMEELTGTVRQTADAAHTANQLAASATASAAQGGEVVAQVVATMDEIRSSSERIADIIGVIDGIAFQTNILALNAAVEAARAGEQGRGFAVVAGEVRSLAQRSAEAAREIKGLIGSSVACVETGSRLVHDAGSSMQAIVASVQRVNDVIGEITAAAAEQSEGIGQVNGAVNQLDQMTQQNAALVEQSAAAAASLRDQARQLSTAVAAFRLAAEPAG